MGAAILLALVFAAYAWWLGSICSDHVNTLAARIENPADVELFRRMYANQSPKSVMTAWSLVLLTPTASYIYQKQWGLAFFSFVTLQALGLWWIIAFITMPIETMNRNKHLADKAFNEVFLVRGGTLLSQPSTVIQSLA